MAGRVGFITKSDIENEWLFWPEETMKPERVPAGQVKFQPIIAAAFTTTDNDTLKFAVVHSSYETDPVLHLRYFGNGDIVDQHLEEIASIEFLTAVRMLPQDDPGEFVNGSLASVFLPDAVPDSVSTGRGTPPSAVDLVLCVATKIIHFPPAPESPAE
ncbi:MAG TPA: hypothetical protein VNT75_00900 [Symbiobacteriaceae bacterium]|nr:hypothetical protein [Symbiobacteriaceae bacterium]